MSAPEHGTTHPIPAGTPGGPADQAPSGEATVDPSFVHYPSYGAYFVVAAPPLGESSNRSVFDGGSSDPEALEEETTR